MRKQLEEAMNFSRKLKEQFLKNNEDMHPHVIVEGKDGPIAIAIAPSLDTDEIMDACLMCRLGFDSEALVVTYDGRVTSITGNSPLANLSLNQEELECIISFRIDKSGKASSLIAPYVMKEEEIVWLEEGLTFQTDTEDDKIRGNIPETMREICSHKPLNQDPEHIKGMIEFDPNLSDFFANKEYPQERISFLIGRAIMGLLMKKKFRILDNLSITHIEWTDARDKAKSLVESLIEEKYIKPTFKQKLNDCIQTNLGTPAFVERFEFLLEQSEFNHPSFKDIAQFVTVAESMCISPLSAKHILKLADEDMIKNQHDLPEQQPFNENEIDEEIMNFLDDNTDEYDNDDSENDNDKEGEEF
jgi:hypothetical protein